MNATDKLTIRGSEIRAELSKLADVEELTDEQTQKIAELRKEYQNVETRLAASITANDEPKEPDEPDEPKEPAVTEFDKLVKQSSLQSILDHVIDKRSANGATAELQQELGINTDEVPLQLLKTDPLGVEVRQLATVAPNSMGRIMQPVVPPVFPMAVTDFLGVSTPTVDRGESVYPILTTREYASDADKGEEVDEYQGVFETKVLEPVRLQAAFFYRREDKSRFAQLESAMRENLRMSLAAGMDNYILNKEDLGLLQFGADPGVFGGGQSTWQTYSDLIFSAVDGLYASDTEQLRFLIGLETYRNAASLYRNANTVLSALDQMRVQSEVRASVYVAAKAGKTQEGVIAHGINLMNSVAPVWQGIHLIPDEITKAKRGEISLTAVMLMNFEVLRADGYQRFKIQLEA